MSDGEGLYIYGIIATDQRQEFGPIGIGGRGDTVYTLPCQGVAAVVSRSPIVKYQVTRENAIAHAKVLEKVVVEHTVLPVRFCTIAADEETIVEKVLKRRRQEFLRLVKEVEGKVELGLRARWRNLDAIFEEVVEENRHIKARKEALLVPGDERKKFSGKIEVGQLVQQALNAKRTKEAQELIQALRPFCLDYKEKQFYGDMNIINVAFLVAKERVPEFDQKVNELEELYRDRKQLKYTSPIVPYNFVELVITW